MTVLKVKHASPGVDPATGLAWRVLRLQGREIPVGAEIDTRDFPRVSKIPHKWAQLIAHGYFHDIDHTADPILSRDLRDYRDEHGEPAPVDTRPEPVIPVDHVLSPTERAEMHATLDKPIALQCGDCGFHAKSESGLAVHQSRKHKKE